MTFKDQAELEASLAYWQRALRLQDWTVKAKIARARDFAKSDSAGECDPTLTLKCASLLLLDPTDYGSEEWWEQDHEQTLIHELLHLHFEPFWDPDKRVAMEQAIDSIAHALVNERRSAAAAQAGSLAGGCKA